MRDFHPFYISASKLLTTTLYHTHKRKYNSEKFLHYFFANQKGIKTRNCIFKLNKRENRQTEKLLFQKLLTIPEEIVNSFQTRC